MAEASLPVAAKGAFAVLAGTLVPVALALERGGGPLGAAEVLHMVACLVITAAGVLALVRWRLVGSASAGWIGVAFMAMGTLDLAGSRLPLQALLGPHLVLAVPVDRLVICAAVSVLLWQALRAPEVDSRLAPRTLLGAVGVVAVCVTGAAEIAAARLVAPGGVTADVVIAAVATLGWTGLAVAAARAARLSRPAPRWLAAVLGLCALGEALQIPAILASRLWVIPAAMVTLLGLATALGCVLQELGDTVRNQDRHALRMVLDLTTMRSRMEVERADIEERMHDLRNALTTVRSAEGTLRRYAGRLDARTRRTLSEALTSELARLQTLVEQDHSVTERDFLLADCLAPVVAVQDAAGSHIDVDVAGVAAHGDPGGLASVVQNLLVNAQRYAAGSEVSVTAFEAAGRVQVLVADEGPGIPASERRRIFARGARGAGAEGVEGEGLGLFVAARTMAQMGGSVRLLETGGKGACFVVELAASSTPSTAPGGCRRSG